MCPEEQSMKKYETEKELINETFSRNLFWKLSDFWWNFSGRFVKTVFYLRVTFWWKAAFASERLISNFFWHWAQTFNVLAKLLPHSCSNCLLRVWRKINCEFQLWAENFDFENFCNFSSINGFRVKIFLFFFQRIFVRAVKAAFYVSRGTGYEKVLVKKRANKQNLFQELVLTTFGLLVDFFRLFCQNCILP